LKLGPNLSHPSYLIASLEFLSILSVNNTHNRY
jgi:hypothetical protein